MLELWRAVEDAIAEGRASGVSNYGVKLQELIKSKPRIMPVVNQIELHPFNIRKEICNFCQQHCIVVEAYAPLVRVLRMEHPTKCGIGEQVSLHTSPTTHPLVASVWLFAHAEECDERTYNFENGKSSHFDISNEDMKELDSLDECLVTSMSSNYSPGG